MPKFEFVIETETLWNKEYSWFFSTTSVRTKSPAGDQRITEFNLAGLLLKFTLRYGVDFTFSMQGYKESGLAVTIKFIRHRNSH